MSRVRIGIALATVAAVAATAIAAAPASAATSLPATQTVTFSNQAAVQVALSANSVNLGMLNPLQVYTFPNATTATVSSNAAWTLTVNGSGSFSDGNGNSIPDGRMTVKQGSFTDTLSASPQTIATGIQPGAVMPIEYDMQLAWNDPIGAAPYTDTLTYVASTP